MTLSIHQPNFMPWFPFFQKIEASDVFVILMHCQFEKNNFQNRFNIGDKWFTMAVEGGMKPITEKKYKNPHEDWKKIKNQLGINGITHLDYCISEHLASTNISLIMKICSMLEIERAVGFDWGTELKGTQRLVEICKSYGAKKYLSGLSGKKYLDERLFWDEDIEVIYQDETKMKKESVINEINFY